MFAPADNENIINQVREIMCFYEYSKKKTLIICTGTVVNSVNYYHAVIQFSKIEEKLERSLFMVRVWREIG